VDNHAHGAASVAPEQVKEVLQDHLINNPGERFNGTPLKEICQGAGITSHESVTLTGTAAKTASSHRPASDDSIKGHLFCFDRSQNGKC